ncbi:hypothetical protein [Streptomyces sp. NPDC006997]|uniref:hypothetical protein n=1 Tax=Streptomyces sp. NPDC006997 TaxID=3155356 RepID=UPI0033CD44B3
MSDTSTSQQLSDSQEHDSHGKHRGPRAAHDAETAPHGRHRKPVDQQHAENAA